MKIFFKINRMLDDIRYIRKLKQQNRLKKCYLLDYRNRYLQFYFNIIQ